MCRKDCNKEFREIIKTQYNRTYRTNTYFNVGSYYPIPLPHSSDTAKVRTYLLEYYEKDSTSKKPHTKQI